MTSNTLIAQADDTILTPAELLEEARHEIRNAVAAGVDGLDKLVDAVMYLHDYCQRAEERRLAELPY